MTTTKSPFELPEMWMELKDRELLLELIEEQGISRRELARFAGWKSHTYLQRLLRGEVSTLSTDPAIRIAYRLQVPVHRLFRTRVSTSAGQSDQDQGIRGAA
jgi:transcriptional regulator with XRE-family HTH domain